MSDTYGDDDYVDPDHPERLAYLARKFNGKCATCRHWEGGYIDEGRTRLLESGWCGLFSPHRGGSLKLRVIGPGASGSQVVTRHDFGCSEWQGRDE